MHWRGHSRRMQELAEYHDVVKEVRDELRQRVDAALAAGVDAGRIILDPGLGFAKRAEHNWRLSAHLDEIIALGFPVLVGASRKSYLGALLADPTGQPRPVAGAGGGDDRDQRAGGRRPAPGGCGCTTCSGTVDALKVLRATRGEPRVTGGSGTDPARPVCGLRGHHGVYDFERAQGQDFVVDVSLELDLAPAAASATMSPTPSTTESWPTGWSRSIAGEPVNLLETLADRLLDVCLADPRVRAATVTVHKPQAPIPHAFDDVSVTLSRSARRAGAAVVTRAVLSLGSNLGDRYAHLRAAVDGLGESRPGRLRGVRDAAVGRPRPTRVPQRRRAGRRRRARPGRGWTGPGTWSRRPVGCATRSGAFGPRTLDVDVIAVWSDDGSADDQRRSRADPAASAGPPARLRAAAVAGHRSRTPSCPGTVSCTT